MVLEVRGLVGPSVPWLSAVIELVDLACPYRTGRLGLPSDRILSVYRDAVVGLSVDSEGCNVASLWLDPGRWLGRGEVSWFNPEADVEEVKSLTLPVRLGAATLLRLPMKELPLLGL